MRKLCVFGASRGTGAHVVSLAARTGFEVVASARNPASVPDLAGVIALQADVYDLASVSRAVAGVDVVISTIGPTKRAPSTDIYSCGVLNIAHAMVDQGVKRLIVVDGLGVDPNPDLPWAYALAMKTIVRWLFGFGYRDAAEMEKRLAKVDLNWTAVRVPWLSSDPAQGFRSANGTQLHHGTKLGREDLAAYLVSIIDDSKTFKKWTEVAW